MAPPARTASGRWRTLVVYALLGPILGAVLPASIAVALLARDYSGPLWISSPSAWLYLVASAFLEGLIPAVLTTISLRVLPGRTHPRVRSTIAYGLISAVVALVLLLPFRVLDEVGQVHLKATAVLGVSGLLAGFLCAVVVQRLRTEGRADTPA